MLCDISRYQLINQGANLEKSLLNTHIEFSFNDPSKMYYKTLEDICHILSESAMLKYQCIIREGIKYKQMLPYQAAVQVLLPPLEVSDIVIEYIDSSVAPILFSPKGPGKPEPVLVNSRDLAHQYCQKNRKTR